MDECRRVWIKLGAAAVCYGIVEIILYEIANCAVYLAKNVGRVAQSV